MTLAAGSIDTDSTATRVASEGPSYRMSPEQLYGEYDANKIAADARYKDKIISITGEINRIGKDITDTAYVVIGGTGLNGVQCMFPKDQESSISRLSRGQIITAQGQLSGQIVGNIIMDGCILK